MPVNCKWLTDIKGEDQTVDGMAKGHKDTDSLFVIIQINNRIFYTLQLRLCECTAKLSVLTDILLVSICICFMMCA